MNRELGFFAFICDTSRADRGEKGGRKRSPELTLNKSRQKRQKNNLFEKFLHEDKKFI
jgi:hypothetical protein